MAQPQSAATDHQQKEAEARLIIAMKALTMALQDAYYEASHRQQQPTSTPSLNPMSRVTDYDQDADTPRQAQRGPIIAQEFDHSGARPEDNTLDCQTAATRWSVLGPQNARGHIGRRSENAWIASYQNEIQNGAARATAYILGFHR